MTIDTKFMKLIGVILNYLRFVNYNVLVKVTRPSFFGGVPSYFEALRYPHLYFYCKSNT